VSLSPPESPPQPDQPPVPAEPAEPPPAAAPRPSLWRHGDFVKLWTASTISLFGSQVSGLAIPAIAIITLNVSPFEAALLGFFEMLPFVLFTLPAGVWVDRLRRRPILIAGDLGRAIVLATIPIAYALGFLTVWQLYAVGFVAGILTVFFDVADQSYLPSLLEADQLIDGNSKLQVSVSAAQIGGQGVGGAIIGLVTAPFAVIADAVSFLASAVLIFLVRKPERAPERHLDAESGRGPGMRAEIAEGLRYVLGNRYLRSIAACTGSSNLFSNLVFSIFLVYVFRNLGLSPLAIGIIGGLANVGFLGGAVIAGRVAKRLGLGRTIVLSSLIAGGMELLIPLAPESAAAIPFLFVSQLVVGAMIVIYNVNQISLRQAITPERMQGRMNATMRFIVWGTIPIGQLLGGAIATAAGLLTAIWVGALGAFLAIIPLLISPVRTLRDMPTPVEGEPTTGVEAA
jgi:MFS family permease